MSLFYSSQINSYWGRINVKLAQCLAAKGDQNTASCWLTDNTPVGTWNAILLIHDCQQCHTLQSLQFNWPDFSLTSHPTPPVRICQQQQIFSFHTSTFLSLLEILNQKTYNSSDDFASWFWFYYILRVTIMAVLSLFAFKTKAAVLGTAPPSLQELGLTSTPDGIIYLFGGLGAL